MNFRCNDIKTFAVKIQYKLDEKNTRESTGTILCPKNPIGYFLVLTTKHSFKEDDEDSFEDVKIEKLNKNNISVIYNPTTIFTPENIIDTENDLVILIIKSSFCMDNQIESIKILKSEFNSCGFIGYANVSKGRLKCFDKCTYNIEHDEMIFEIDSNKVLQSSNKDEILATEGLSGSGLFTIVNNEYLLAGVISNVITDNNSFDCVNLAYLLKDIPLDEYGGIEVVSKETSIEKTPKQLLSSNNIIQEEYKTIIQEQVTKEFMELKETYLNGSEKKIEEWLKDIKTSPKWNILSNIQQAQILYEETKLTIQKNDLERASELIKKIQSLDSSLYINRLLSWIEINQNNIPKAISLLDNNEIGTLNQKIAIYLEVRDFDNAKQAIDTIKVEDRNHETYRVKAIYELYVNSDNYSQALKDINKSLSFKSDYIEAKKIKAMILFYKATYFTVLPHLVPPIIQNDMLKIDKESQENIQIAYKLFEEIEQNYAEHRDIAWITTIKWLTNRDSAIEYIEQLYKNEDYKRIAIQFIIVYNLDINIEESIKTMESEETIDGIYKADTLIRYYFRNQNREKTFELLDKYKDIYIKENSLDNWNENYINALSTFKMDKELLEFIQNNDIKEKDEIEAHIYKIFNDYESACNLYEKLFKQTQKPIYRLIICEMKSEENDWNYLTQYTDYLLEHFQTEKVVELVVLGEINSQNFAKAKELVDKWLPSIQNKARKNNFLRIKAICESALGSPWLSMQIYEENNFMNSDEDIANLTYFYRKTASYEKLEDLAVKSIDNKNLHIDTKIKMVSMVDDNSPLLGELVKKNNIEKSDTFLIKKDFRNNNRVFQKIHKLGDNEILLYNEASGEGTLINLEHEMQKKHKYTLYQKSDMPTHQLDDVKFFERYYKQNEEMLYIRSAKKYNFVEIKNYKNISLYLDVTSLILFFSIGKLQMVIDSFQEIYLSSKIFILLDDIGVSNKLIDLVRKNQKLKKIFFSIEVNQKIIKESQDISNSIYSMYSLLEFEKENGLVCVDDRYINGFYQTKNKQKIISINDILFTFFQEDILTEKEYYSSLLEMRKRNYLYLLITSKEILYYLTKCQVIENEVEESEELKVLKESLNFMVQNFKYLKPFEQTEIEKNQYSEPFFVINQAQEINHTIIDLWNTEFEYEEDRKAYLDWIMNNLFTLNMTNFIQNKLVYNHDITSLFIEPITIISDKNQKLYFEWFYQHFLYNFFKANPNLISELIENIKSMIMTFFLKDEINEYSKVLTAKLLFNFPESIKNELLKDNQLISSLALDKQTTIKGLQFQHDEFIYQVKRIINGSKEEKVITTNKQNSMVLKSLTIKNQKYIIINDNTNEVLEDTYIILSTSRQKRKKLLEANPQWFNMSNRKKNELIEKIINIQNHHERIDKLYQVQEDSKFYYKIQKDLEEQRLNFDSLIPDNIDILLNHFRLDKNLPFEDSFNLAVETLVNEEEISKTIDVVHHFPISFPQSIIDNLNKKSDEEQKDILKSFWRTSSTPISHIQLLKVLIATKNENFKKVIIYLTKKIFTEEFQLELKAFFVLKNFIKQEFNLKYSSLNDDIKLALIWSHSNKLMKYFNYNYIDCNWIIKEFKSQSNRLTIEIFRPDSDYNLDILNGDFSYEEFIMTSLAYIIDGNFDYFKNSKIETKINSLIKEETYPNFIQLGHIRPNIIHSFLQLKDISFLSSFPILENTLQTTEKELKINQPFAITLFAFKYNFYPLKSELKSDLIKTIQDYKFDDRETSIILYDLLFFTKQLKYINNRNISKQVIKLIKDISPQIETRQEKGTLFEILIYLSMRKTNHLKSRIKLLVKYIQWCSVLHNEDEIKFIVNRFLFEFPLEYSKYFLPLKFQTYKKLEKET